MGPLAHRTLEKADGPGVLKYLCSKFEAVCYSLEAHISVLKNKRRRVDISEILLAPSGCRFPEKNIIDFGTPAIL